MADDIGLGRPIRGCPFTLSFPLRDSAGALVTGEDAGANADSEVSLDNAGFADCVNEIDEDDAGGGGDSGMYSIQLTAAELAASEVKYKLTTDNSLGVTATLYPVPCAVVRDDTAQAGGAATLQLASGDVEFDGQLDGYIVKLDGGTGSGQAARIIGSVESTDTITVAANWDTQPDGTTTYQILMPPERAEEVEAQVVVAAADIANLHAIIPVVSIPVPANVGVSPVRISIAVIDAMGDLPTSAEITPGTITIARRPLGGIAWIDIVSADAMSESDGMIYYDVTFLDASYNPGDEIKVELVGQEVVIDGTTYEVFTTSVFTAYSFLRESMRGTDSAATATALASHDTDIKALEPHGTAMRGTDSAATAAALSQHDTDIKALEPLGTAMRGTDSAATAAALTSHDTDIKALEPHGTPMRGTDNAALAATALSTAVWTAARAGYLDKLNVGAETLAHTGNSASFMADVSALALEATLTAMKGAGWTDESLKAIKDAVDGVSAGDATLANQTTIMSALNVMANAVPDEALPAFMDNGFTSLTDALEAIRNRGDTSWTTGGATGTNTRTFVVEDVGGSPLQGATVIVRSSAGAEENLRDGLITETLGDAVTGLDDGTYYVQATLNGYNHTEEEVVVSGHGSTTLTMTEQVIGGASQAGSKRVWAYPHQIDLSLDATDDVPLFRVKLNAPARLADNTGSLTEISAQSQLHADGYHYIDVGALDDLVAIDGSTVLTYVWTFKNGKVEEKDVNTSDPDPVNYFALD